MDVTVCVGTYGDDAWNDLAAARAIPSAERQGPSDIVHVHAESLLEARNRALELVTTPWVCFLDADDELENHYFERMRYGRADLRAPSVRYVRNGFDQGERVPQVAGHAHECGADCLAFGNWLVIGTLAPTELVRHVGGFRDFPWSEDWDLWVRCWKAGATVEAVPRAVYRAHVRTGSRNRALTVDERIAAHNLIADANGLPLIGAAA